MRKIIIATLGALLFSACLVERAIGPSEGDAAPRADGGAADAAVPDVVGQDLVGVDAARPDTLRPDTLRPDSARPDTLGYDAARPDAAVACGDDSYEPNNSSATPAPVTAPGTTSGLVGCPSNDDWYSFTLPAGRPVTVTIQFIDNDADLDLRIYAAANPGSSIDSSASTSDNEDVHAPAYGVDTPMLIYVQHFSGGVAPYSMTISYPEPPANDSCATAAARTLPAGGQPITLSGDTTGAGDTRNGADASCQGRFTGDLSRELFYSFTTTATMDGVVTADLSASGWYGVVYAFEGSCAAAADLACGDARIAFQVQPSTTYYLAVDAYDIEAGPFDLTLRFHPPPSNNACESAQPLGVPTDGSELLLPGSTLGATQTRGSTDSDNSCQATARFAPEVFYTFTTSAAGTLQVSLDSPGWDAAFYLFEDSCAAASDLLCVGEYYFEDPIWTRLSVAASTTYYLVVDGYGDICCDRATGPYWLSLRYYLPQPTLEGGETCDAAVPLPGTAGGAHGSTASGSDDLDPGDIGCSGWAGGYDKFYLLTLGAGQTATVRLEHGDRYNQPVLYVLRTDCPVRADSCIDAITFDEAASGELTWQNSSSTAVDYFVVVDATYTYEGEAYDLFWEITGP